MILWLRGYAAADDPRVAAANLVALVLAWNTPFWPLYLRAAAGPAIWPGGWLTLCVFPVFLAVPGMTRRWPFGGRVVLAAAATVNTLFCTWLLGESSGTPLFLLPCVTLAALLFDRSERSALLFFLGLPIVAGVALNGRYPASPLAGAGVALVWLNAISVAAVTAFFGWLVSGLPASAAQTPR